MPDVNNWKMESYFSVNELPSHLVADGHLIRFFHKATHHVYDTRTAIWTTDTSAPQINADQCCICNGTLYLGVTQYTKYVLYAYDMAQKTWTQKGEMSSQPYPSPQFRVIGKKIYLPQYVYDTESDTWSALSSPPSTSYLGRGTLHAVVGSKMFVVVNDTNYNSHPIHILIYDTTNDTWTTGASTDINPVSGLGVEAAGEKIYLLSSYLGKDRKILVYDTVSDTFSKGIEYPTFNETYRTTTIGSTIYCQHHKGFMMSYDTSCSSGGDPEPPSQGSLARLGITLATGKNVQSSVSASLADNTAYTFSTEDPAVATVGADGLVWGVAPGATRLKAVKPDEDFAESMPVRVTEGGTEPDPGADGNGQYFLFVEKDDGGKMHFHAREISECDC